jgi:hypothetical protein
MLVLASVRPQTRRCSRVHEVSALHSVSVDITKFVDAAQPGWVECVLRDAHGVAWTFVEKVPSRHSREPQRVVCLPSSRLDCL